MKECKHTYTRTHSLTQTDKTLKYELIKLLLSFLLQYVTAVVEKHKSLCFIGAKPNSAALFGPPGTPHTLMVVPSRGAGHPYLQLLLHFACLLSVVT